MGGDGFEGVIGLDGLADGFIIDVGDVADMADVESKCGEGTAQDVLKDEGAEVADVCTGVNSRATAIHAEGMAVVGVEGFDGAGEGVVELQRSGLTSLLEIDLALFVAAGYVARGGGRKGFLSDGNAPSFVIASGVVVEFGTGAFIDDEDSDIAIVFADIAAGDAFSTFSKVNAAELVIGDAIIGDDWGGAFIEDGDAIHFVAF